VDVGGVVRSGRARDSLTVSIKAVNDIANRHQSGQRWAGGDLPAGQRHLG
jgi:hypothetical protein